MNESLDARYSVSLRRLGLGLGLVWSPIIRWNRRLGFDDYHPIRDPASARVAATEGARGRLHAALYSVDEWNGTGAAWCTELAYP